MIGKTISHYQIQSRLGRGGMGEVYKALDTKLKRQVALKFLAPHVLGSEDGRKRFLREARSAAALNNPAICTVYEIDEIDGQVFIAMEFLEGQNLAERIRAGPIPLHETTDIIIQIAEGLREAHGKGFVHRDIKPANIVITPQGRVVILDFGLARSLEASRLTTAGVVTGTTPYLAPEQARGDPVDQRADIWALGVVLYEMIAGRRPFEGEIDEATLYQILHEEPPSLSKLVPELPPSMARLIARALAKDLAARYHRVQDLLDELEAVAAPSSGHAGADPHAVTLRIPSIAVLPFNNLTGDPEREFLCDGLAEELINALTTIRPLKVVARTSSFAFKGRGDDIRLIGKVLDVASVLQGSVQIDDNRIRISAQLIDTRDGCHLWSQRFERELTDLFAIQDEIALATVSFLKPKLLNRERDALLKRNTEDIEAYQLYHKGFFFYNRMSKNDFQTAARYYQAAIALDPGFALAYVGLGGVHGFSGTFGYGPHLETAPQGIRAVERALQLDDSIARAHASRGIFHVGFEWDWDSAQRRIERAEKLDPSHFVVHLGFAALHLVRTELDGAIERLRSWARLDPLSVLQMSFLTWNLIDAGRLDEARAEVTKALELAPHFDRLHWYLAKIEVLEGRHEEGIACMLKAVELSSRDPAMLAGMGWALAVSGQADETREIIDELNARAVTEYVRPFELIKVHAALGQVDEAFDCLEQAYVGREDMLVFCRTDPTLRALHSDPRWADLISRMKFPASIREEA